MASSDEVDPWLLKSERGKFFRLFRSGNMGYKKMPKELREAIGRQLVKSLRLVRDTIRMEMRKKKTGKIYYIRGRRHQASAPGEAPAILSGRLYRSIVAKVAANKLSGRIAPRVKYAHYLEEGTTRIKPRPYLNPAFEQHRQNFRQNLRKTVQTVLKKRAAKARAARLKKK